MEEKKEANEVKEAEEAWELAPAKGAFAREGCGYDQGQTTATPKAEWRDPHPPGNDANV